MDEEFEKNYYSKTAKGIYKIGHDGKRLKNWMVYYDRFHENNIYYDLMASVLSCLKEIS